MDVLPLVRKVGSLEQQVSPRQGQGREQEHLELASRQQQDDEGQDKTDKAKAILATETGNGDKRGDAPVEDFHLTVEELHDIPQQHERIDHTQAMRIFVMTAIRHAELIAAIGQKTTETYGVDDQQGDEESPRRRKHRAGP